MALFDGTGRLRGTAVTSKLPKNIGFINPYPWMSSIEARVHLALESHSVPFSWRYFDGVSPTFTAQFGSGGYQPEFTFLEIKTIAIVQGSFWGALDEVLQTVSLAQTCFEIDGWKVAILWEGDILSTGAWELLIREIPALATISGPQRVNPYATAAVLAGMKRTRGGVRDKLSTLTGGTHDTIRSVRAGAYHFNSTTGRRRLGRKGAVTEYRGR